MSRCSWGLFSEPLWLRLHLTPPSPDLYQIVLIVPSLKGQFPWGGLRRGNRNVSKFHICPQRQGQDQRTLPRAARLGSSSSGIVTQAA